MSTIKLIIKRKNENKSVLTVFWLSSQLLHRVHAVDLYVL